MKKKRTRTVVAAKCSTQFSSSFFHLFLNFARCWHPTVNMLKQNKRASLVFIRRFDRVLVHLKPFRTNFPVVLRSKCSEIFLGILRELYDFGLAHCFCLLFSDEFASFLHNFSQLCNWFCEYADGYFRYSCGFERGCVCFSTHIP